MSDRGSAVMLNVTCDDCDGEAYYNGIPVAYIDETMNLLVAPSDGSFSPDGGVWTILIGNYANSSTISITVLANGK
jgi:hypothetical protein